MMDGNFLITTFQWIIGIWSDHLSPYYVMECYESGVLLRLGKYKKNLKEGLNWKIPFIDTVLTVNSAIDTMETSPVSITDIDGKQVTVHPIIKFVINDPKKHLIETNSAYSNLKDICRGVVADHLTDCSWEQIKDKKTLTAIKNLMRKETEDIGVNIIKVYFGRIVTTKTYTVFKE